MPDTDARAYITAAADLFRMDERFSRRMNRRSGSLHLESVRQQVFVRQPGDARALQLSWQVLCDRR